MRTQNCCLSTSSEIYLRTGLSDMAVKMKLVYSAEIQVVADTGRVPLNLFSALLVWRSELSFEAKSAEGLHVHVQAQARVAPSLGEAHLADRLQLKLGEELDAVECCSLHHAVLDSMKEGDYLNRFDSVGEDAPPEIAVKVCQHEDKALLYSATGFASPMQRSMPRRGDVLYSFFKPLPRHDSTTAHIVEWSYYSRKSVGVGTAHCLANTGLFELSDPLMRTCVFDIVKEHWQQWYAEHHDDPLPAPEEGGAAADPERVPKRRRVGQRPTLELYSYPMTWPDPVDPAIANPEESDLPHGQRQLFGHVELDKEQKHEIAFRTPAPKGKQRQQRRRAKGPVLVLPWGEEVQVDEDFLDDVERELEGLPGIPERDEGDGWEDTDDGGDHISCPSEQSVFTDVLELDEDGTELPQPPDLAIQQDDDGEEEAEDGDGEEAGLDKRLSNFMDHAIDRRREAMQAAIEQARAVSGRLTEPGVISLVRSTAGDLHFVMWVYGSHARILRIDTKGRIIPLVYSRDKPVPFDDALLLIADTKAVYVKTVRMEMPEWALLVFDWFAISRAACTRDEGPLRNLQTFSGRGGPAQT